MKKIIFIFVFGFVFLFSFNTINVKAYTYDTLSNPAGVNLLDKNNLIVDEEEGYLSFSNPVYINKGENTICIQIRDDCIPYGDGFDNEIEICLYDKDLCDEGCYYVYLEGEKSSVKVEGGNKNFYYIIFNAEEIENIYAFEISYMPCNKKVLEDEAMIVSLGDEPLSEFVEFEGRVGFIKLDSETHPILHASYTKKISDDDIKSFLIAKDGYKGVITSSIVLDSSEYTNKYDTIGSYMIKAKVSDDYNTAESYFFIIVKDKIPPVITGDSELKFPIGYEITDSEILGHYNASDEYQGDVKHRLKIDSTYVSTPQAETTQTITLSCTDKYENKTTKTITLKTVDCVAPVISGDDVIYKGYEVSISRENLIKNNYTITDDTDPNPKVEFIQDTYTLNRNKIGTWNLTIRATDKAGNKSEKSISIVVSDGIAPVIYMNTYVINTLSTVALTDSDLVDILCDSGELKKGKKYNVTVVNNTYKGHESVEGVYAYQAIYTDENNESIEKILEINVLDSTYTIETVDTLNKYLYYYVTVGALTCLSITLLVVMIFKRKKHV